MVNWGGRRRNYQFHFECRGGTPYLVHADATHATLAHFQAVIDGLLINRVEPTYPPLAEQARI